MTEIGFSNTKSGKIVCENTKNVDWVVGCFKLTILRFLIPLRGSNVRHFVIFLNHN